MDIRTFSGVELLRGLVYGSDSGVGIGRQGLAYGFQVGE